jgi:predicted Zn-dependent peptidase
MMDNVYADRFVVSASMQPENVKPTLEMIKAIIVGLLYNPIPDAEIEAAKQYLIGSLPLGMSSSQRIAGTLASLQLADRPITALDDYSAKIKAVTAKDLRRVAWLFFEEDPIIVMVGAAPKDMDYETITTIPNAEKPTPPITVP